MVIQASRRNHHVKFHVAGVFADSAGQTFDTTNAKTLAVIICIERYVELTNVANMVTLSEIVEVCYHGSGVPRTRRMECVAYGVCETLLVEFQRLHALNISYILIELFEHDGDRDAACNLFCLIDVEGYRLSVNLNYHFSKSIVCNPQFQFCQRPRILVL